MAVNTENGGERRISLLRIAAWSAAVLVLLLPWLAMRFTDEVNWTVADFVFAGALLLGVGIPFDLAVRKTGDTAYRAAVGLALAAVFLLVWLSLSVGIIGADGDPANLMYFGVIAVGIIGALAARLHPLGIARALLAVALAQALLAVIALVGGLGYPWSGPLEIVGLNGFFVALFAGSAWLFWCAAHGRPERGGA